MLSLIENSIEIFYQKLGQKLKNDLIGEKAHLKMIPRGRDLHPTQDANPRQSAVLIAFYLKNNELYFPLIKRTKSNGAHSGQMALPGGKPEPSDKDLIETALREAEEEVGILRNKVKVIGCLSDIYIGVTNISVLPVVGFLNEAPNFKPQQSEVDGIYEVRLSDLLDPELKRNETWDLRGNEIEVPFYELNGTKVWGATAMILSELETILKS